MGLICDLIVRACVFVAELATGCHFAAKRSPFVGGDV